MTFHHPKNNSPKIAYTVTGDIANVLRAIDAIQVDIIKQKVTEPVDLWLLQTNPELHKRLETESHIRRVFVSPVRDRRFSNPDHFVRAIPVYGRYEEVVHLGAGVETL